jgi:outer membrane receptor for ferrienterochelin and colicin
MPSIEMAASRWRSITSGQWHYQTGSYFLTNFNADDQIASNVKLSAGVRNRFDKR